MPTKRTEMAGSSLAHEQRDALNLRAAIDASKQLGIKTVMVAVAPGVDAAAVAPHYRVAMEQPTGTRPEGSVLHITKREDGNVDLEPIRDANGLLLKTAPECKLIELPPHLFAKRINSEAEARFLDVLGGMYHDIMRDCPTREKRAKHAYKTYTLVVKMYERKRARHLKRAFPASLQRAPQARRLRPGRRLLRVGRVPRRREGARSHALVRADGARHLAARRLPHRRADAHPSRAGSAEQGGGGCPAGAASPSPQPVQLSSAPATEVGRPAARGARGLRIDIRRLSGFQLPADAYREPIVVYSIWFVRQLAPPQDLQSERSQESWTSKTFVPRISSEMLASAALALGLAVPTRLWNSGV